MHIHFFYVMGAFMGIVMFAVVLFILNQAALANIKQAGHMAILSEKRVLFEHQQMELQRLKPRGEVLSYLFFLHCLVALLGLDGGA